MVRRIIIPLCGLAIFFAIALVVDARRAYQTKDFLVCGAHSASTAGERANILFLGTSRTANAIDPAYLQKRLNQVTGSDITVERISQDGSNAVFLSLLSRDHIQHHGVPDHVFIEVMYDQEPVPESRKSDLTLEFLPRSIMLGSAAAYKDISRSKHFSTNVFERNYINIVEFFSLKYMNAFYHYLEDPRISIPYAQDTCADSSWKKREGRWLFDDLTVDMAQTLPSRATVDDEKLRAESAEMVLRAPKANYRRYENAVLNDLIDVFTESGSQSVSLIIYPLYAESNMLEKELAAFNVIFPGANIIYLGDLFDNQKLEEREVIFGNVNHFNDLGALKVSNYFVDFIRRKYD